MATNGIKILMGGIIGSILIFPRAFGMFGIISGLIILIALALYASHTDIMIEKLINSQSKKNKSQKKSK